MKRIIITLCLVVLTLNAYAERKFVLVELYHLKRADFGANNYDLVKNIYKPHCNAGGTPEIDTGSLYLGNRPPGPFGEIRGRVDDHPEYNYWKIVFPNFIISPCSTLDCINLNVRIYCAYPIQCIKP